jgi:3',5'-cyclic AMP phosphodiesterase CpdA
MKIIHISDLHISTGINDRVQSILSHIYSKYFFGNDSDTHLLITGDVVDDGQDAQYSMAKKLLEPFTGRLLVCPGNHDYARLGNFYESDAIKRFGGLNSLAVHTLSNFNNYLDHDLPVIDLLGNVLFIGLNTNLNPHTFDFACGEVGTNQLHFLNETLTDPKYEDHWKIVYLHHKPLKLKWYNWPFFRLKDRAKFLSIVEPAADVVAFGHSESTSQQLIKLPGLLKDGTYFLNADNCVNDMGYFDITINDRISVEYCRAI